MGLIPQGGNDRVYTPENYAQFIVDYFKPEGLLLEPCRGRGAFTKAMPTADWCEIDEGRDFFDYNKKVDWIITNPPYSKFRAFLNKSMETADNIVFLCLINAFFMKARLRDITNMKFGFKTIMLLDTPKSFPQMGIQLGCVYLQKDYLGKIEYVNATTKIKDF